MRNAFLVAAREYAENARTKGFWIGIIMVPVLLVGFIFVVRWLEQDATPTRHYVVVDQTGSYTEVLESAIDRRWAQQALLEFVEWTGRNLKDEFGDRAQALDLESMPELPALSLDAFDPDRFLDLLAEQYPELFTAIAQPGGLDLLVEGVRPMLREDAEPFDPPRRKLQQVALPAEIDPAAPASEIAEQLKPYLRGEQMLPAQSDDGQPISLFAALIIPEGADEVFSRREGDAPADAGEPAQGDEAVPQAEVEGQDEERPVQYWSANLADDELLDHLRVALDRELRQSQFIERDVNVELVREVQDMSFTIKKLDPDKAAGEEEVSAADELREIAPIGFVYLLWISVMQVAAMLLNNTVEEKSNRIIEVLLSSVTAWELMAGKLLGIAGIGLTMLGTWILSAALLLWYWASPEAEMINSLASVIFDSTLLPAFIFYFVMGYFMYAGVFLAIGSICNTVKEAQNFMGPVMMIMVVPLFTMMFIPKDPHGTLATALSWVPIYTPFVMMNRAAADPPAFEVWGTSILLLVSNVVVLWLCGRIFRTGILRTGQPPRLKELLAWMRRGAQ